MTSTIEPASRARDTRHMRAALALARRALGHAWPNPAVGCVLVRGDGHRDRIVGRGWTQPGGRPHGEAEALRRAGRDAQGATAYVSLEPCSHHGQTAPCAEALVTAGVARAVVALEDPDPRVSGGGLAHLKKAGVETVLGPCATEAGEINAGFFLRLSLGRPLVTVKLATTLDGQIATRSGESRWITESPARDRTHLLRAGHDAVVIGIGTALADDPMLTCRLPGLAERAPVRVVFDSGLRLPPDGRLAATAGDAPVWVVAGEGVDEARCAALTERGVRVFEVARDGDGRPEASAALVALGAAGLTRVLIEGGGRLSASLFAASVVDRIEWFRAPVVMGADGIPGVADLAVAALDAMPAFERIAIQRCGRDVLESYRRRP